METRVCYKCGMNKTISDFTNDKYRNDGVGRKCKSCCSDFMKLKRQQHKQNKDRVVAKTKRCPACKETLSSDAFNRDSGSWSGLQAYCKECAFKKRETVRLEVLVRYSSDPPYCLCCGERRFQFLSIGHINGGGRQHAVQRRNNGEGTTLFMWLKRNGYPEGYQILCHNCNQAKGYYGICPHQKERDEARLDQEQDKHRSVLGQSLYSCAVGGSGSHRGS